MEVIDRIVDHMYDSSSEIQRCLNCEKSYCDDCLHTGRYRFSQTDYDFIKNTDLTNQEYAIYFGVTLDQIYQLRKKIGKLEESNDSWTAEEINYLLSHSIEESVRNLGKTKAACYNKRFRLRRMT